MADDDNVGAQAAAHELTEDEKRLHVDTPQRIIGASAASGALFGLLFFVPGMVLLGGAIGALMGTFAESAIDAEFRNRVEHLVEPGHSAVVIMALAGFFDTKVRATLQIVCGHRNVVVNDSWRSRPNQASKFVTAAFSALPGKFLGEFLLIALRQRGLKNGAAEGPHGAGELVLGDLRGLSPGRSCR